MADEEFKPGAKNAIAALDSKPGEIFDAPASREELGSVEGTLQDVGTYYNYPAVRIIESRTKNYLWCRLSNELQSQFQDKAAYAGVWQHRRVIVRGRIKYGEDGAIAFVIAHDIRRVEARSVSLDELKDKDFTGGLSVAEYLDRFRDGALGRKRRQHVRWQ